MFYARLNKDGEVDRYPYTLTDLKYENKHISFPDVIDESVVDMFNVRPVTLTEPPEINHTQNLIRSAAPDKKGQWFETWTIENATPGQIKERTNTKVNEIRVKRNQLLLESDWTQCIDSPVNQEAWANYRQLLRNIPQQEGFPWDISWPEKP
jgi:hypothetical protein